MAKADLEGLVLNALNLNDDVTLVTEVMTFTPAQARAKFAENPNADGVLLVEEPQFTPSYFELQVRVVPTVMRENKAIYGTAEASKGWAVGSGTGTIESSGFKETWSFAGSKSFYLKFKATANNQAGQIQCGSAVVEQIPVVAGETYTASIRYNLLQKGTRTLNAFVSWFNASNVLISTSSFGEVSAIGTGRVSGVVTAPAGATHALVIIGYQTSETHGLLNGETIEMYADQAILEVGSHAGEPDFPTPAQLTADEARWVGAANESASQFDGPLFAVGRLMDALASCAKTEGGQTFEWTPNETEGIYTAYAILGELLDVPIDQNGELAGWFVNAPVLKIKLTCRPFLYKEERLVLASTVSTKPTQTVYIGNIEGDVPAEARMVITNKVAKGMRYAEWGMDVVSSETNPTLEYEGTVGLKYAGFIGESSTKAGSQSVNVIKAKLSTIPAAICTTGPIEHIGDFEAKLRVYVSTTSYEQTRVMFRVSYRSGNGDWASRDWVEIPTTNEWVEMDLLEVFLEEVEKGTQVSEIRVEAKNLEQQSTVYVDLLTLIPAKRRAVARSEAKFDIPTVMKAADTMAQTAGNATGKTMDLGGNYTVFAGSDTTDFTISEGKLKRTAVSDTGTIYSNGRAIGPPSNFSGNLAVRIDFTHETSSSFSSNPYFGQMLCYASETNYILVFFQYAGGAGASWYCNVINGKIEALGVGAGLVEGLGGSATKVSGSLVSVIEGERLTIWIAGEDGIYRRHVSVVDEKSKQVGVAGRVGVYDSNVTANASTREYDNFAVWTPELPTVCEPSKSLEIGSDGAIRQDSGGSFYTPVPEYRGGDLFLEPAGKGNVINRISSKIRRNDTKLEADENITDERALEVFARERFLMPR